MGAVLLAFQQEARGQGMERDMERKDIAPLRICSECHWALSDTQRAVSAKGAIPLALASPKNRCFSIRQFRGGHKDCSCIQDAFGFQTPSLRNYSMNRLNWLFSGARQAYWFLVVLRFRPPHSGKGNRTKRR